jgi:hypothetical protein
MSSKIARNDLKDHKDRIKKKSKKNGVDPKKKISKKRVQRKHKYYSRGGNPIKSRIITLIALGLTFFVNADVQTEQPLQVEPITYPVQQTPPIQKSFVLTQNPAFGSGIVSYNGNQKFFSDDEQLEQRNAIIRYAQGFVDPNVYFPILKSAVAAVGLETASGAVAFAFSPQTVAPMFALAAAGLTSAATSTLSSYGLYPSSSKLLSEANANTYTPDENLIDLINKDLLEKCSEKVENCYLLKTWKRKNRTRGMKEYDEALVETFKSDSFKQNFVINILENKDVPSEIKQELTEILGQSIFQAPTNPKYEKFGRLRIKHENLHELNKLISKYSNDLNLEIFAHVVYELYTGNDEPFQSIQENEPEITTLSKIPIFGYFYNFYQHTQLPCDQTKIQNCKKFVDLLRLKPEYYYDRDEFNKMILGVAESTLPILNPGTDEYKQVTEAIQTIAKRIPNVANDWKYTCMSLAVYNSGFFGSMVNTPNKELVEKCKLNIENTFLTLWWVAQVFSTYGLYSILSIVLGFIVLRKTKQVQSIDPQSIDIQQPFLMLTYDEDVNNVDVNNNVLSKPGVFANTVAYKFVKWVLGNVTLLNHVQPRPNPNRIEALEDKQGGKRVKTKKLKQSGGNAYFDYIINAIGVLDVNFKVAIETITEEEQLIEACNDSPLIQTKFKYLQSTVLITDDGKTLNLTDFFMGLLMSMDYDETYAFVFSKMIEYSILDKLNEKNLDKINGNQLRRSDVAGLNAVEIAATIEADEADEANAANAANDKPKGHGGNSRKKSTSKSSSKSTSKSAKSKDAKDKTPKSTSERVLVDGKKRVVYVGPKGGKYIKKDGKFLRF